MLHCCIERERVGVDGSKIVDVARRHDPSVGVKTGGSRVGGPELCV